MMEYHSLTFWQLQIFYYLFYVKDIKVHCSFCLISLFSEILCANNWHNLKAQPSYYLKSRPLFWWENEAIKHKIWPQMRHLLTLKFAGKNPELASKNSWHLGLSETGLFIGLNSEFVKGWKKRWKFRWIIIKTPNWNEASCCYKIQTNVDDAVNSFEIWPFVRFYCLN